MNGVAMRTGRINLTFRSRYNRRLFIHFLLIDVRVLAS